MGMKGEQQAVTPRFDGVDVLRGFSILSVVLLHTWIRMHFPGSPCKPGDARPACSSSASKWRQRGYGVLRGVGISDYADLAAAVWLAE
jgi:hypothetical protein